MKSVRRIGWVVAIVPILAFTPRTNAAEAAPQPELERLKAHVARLASAEFAGRRGEGARKAEVYVTEQLRALGLEPLFAGSFTQDIPGPEAGQILGRNVAARLKGTDPDLQEEFILLSAHYDHLGTQNGRLFPGADDNASGVAMLLEVARCLVEAPERPRRSVLFVAFDLEENGLWGSRHFVAAPPIALNRIKLVLTADLIGGALGGVCAEQLFIMGSEHAPGLRPWVEQAAQGHPLKVALVGSDLLVFDRSDYGPFRARHIPYLFFSTGETPRYHTPNDTPESLDYPKLEAISRTIAKVVQRAADAETVPAWNALPDAPLTEAQALRDVFQTLLDHRATLKIGSAQAVLLTSAVKQLDSVLVRGTFTPEERTRIVRVAQFVLYTLL